MFEDEVKLLLENEWTDEEKTLIENLISTVMYFKRMLPKTFKQDILCALQMCNSLKIELDVYRNKSECKCENKCECKCENICENKSECKCE